VRKGHTRTHTHTNTHASKRAHDRMHTSNSQCPLELGEVEGHVFIFIGPGCLEILILHLFLPPACPATHPSRSRHCSHAPYPSFPTSSPLYPLFIFSFSVVMSLTFRQSLTYIQAHTYTHTHTCVGARQHICFCYILSCMPAGDLSSTPLPYGSWG